ncbi:unnamed protein product [Dracunculus medinensis]|uniref:HEME_HALOPEROXIDASE domain-containing protein n=1 Tax=Dracunculus medinensis TaxID=318479 RepID=A0A0N4UEZ7_DRAME|nr:unnamed protein product [Dracunculus medinensis]
MAFLCILLSTAWTIINGLPPPMRFATDPATVNANAQRFLELYGLATEIMNFGGSIINNAKGTYRENNDRYELSGNSILGDALRFFGPRRYNEYDMAPYKSTVLGPQYGNGFLGIGNTRNVQSTRQIGLEALLDTFLGPSLTFTSTASPTNFFSPEVGSRSSIDDLINALVRSGAKRVTPDPYEGRNILSTFFGK